MQYQMGDCLFLGKDEQQSRTISSLHQMQTVAYSTIRSCKSWISNNWRAFYVITNFF
jgi:hypothetical protein